MNRRAKTWAPIKSNSIFGLVVLKNGWPQKQMSFHYQRRMQSGEIYTGPVRLRGQVLI